MNKFFRLQSVARLALAGVMAVAFALSLAARNHENEHATTVFQGKVVNGGTAIHFKMNGKSYLKVSDDFKIPGTPDPHWQVIDSKGEAHLLQALKLKEGLSNRQIELPGHVPDVAKVQIWCAFAEVLLGEASFAKPVK
jgi:hypothetical protein